MNKTVECKSCGNVYPENKEKCEYCGTVNSAPKIETEKDQNKETRFYSGPIEKTPKGEVNVLLLVLLAIVFWPAAIIYYIYCEKNKN